MRYVLLICLALAFLTINAQKRKKVNWTEWSDSTAFFQGRIPVITGYGQYSDSLSTAYNGKTFFEVNGVYYVINSAADYYLWFTNKYPYLFNESIETYRYFYREKDNYNMLRFIESTYTGAKRPLKFVKTNSIHSHPQFEDNRGAEQRENDQMFGRRSGYGPPLSKPKTSPKKSSPKKQNSNTKN